MDNMLALLGFGLVGTFVAVVMTSTIRISASVALILVPVVFAVMIDAGLFNPVVKRAVAADAADVLRVGGYRFAGVRGVRLRQEPAWPERPQQRQHQAARAGSGLTALRQAISVWCSRACRPTFAQKPLKRRQRHHKGWNAGTARLRS